ncbi:outer membrane protein transport protein [uncultured Polaribacter sp.]|uniref:OmpP1/FadL family transporter n=1 Tax=uncultured Polaribacter sp. TaxID=174711 RepID=UPI00262F9BF9|nr:outer membrane protein transport protein [uncultured Polaribacter sp.]
MKRYITIAILFAVTITSNAQSLGYQDLGLLFSENDNNGSARFTAMAGAFGSLGGDVSAINVNPAGISVFNTSTFSGTFNSRNSETTANYFGNSLKTQDQFFNLSHAGAVLVFDSAYKSEWNKFAIGFNYRITKDFTNSFLANGNSGVATFREFPLDNTIDYNIADEQFFSNNYSGKMSEFNLAFSAVHQKKLHVGLSLNFYDLNFSQRAQLTEFNSDASNNELDANLYQENTTLGSGFSANAGFIYKANQNFRFGLAYQTPTWFTELFEATNITDNDGFLGDTEITVSNDNRAYSNTADGFFPSQEFFYRLKTPGRLTASAAYIFDKNGLISLDYIHRGYNALKLSNSDFRAENQFFENDLRNTHSFNLGTEWRFDRFSIRGGYQFEQSPNISSIESGTFKDSGNVIASENINGYSFGGGYNFGKFKIDLSYSNNNRNGVYNFYAQQEFDVTETNLTIDNRTVTATITLDL